MSDRSSDPEASSPPSASTPNARSAEFSGVSKKGTVAELLDAFNLNWSAPRTFWALLRRPREVVRAYQQHRAAPRDPLLAQQAQRYLSPFKYVVLATALFTFVSAFVIDMEAEMQRASEMGLGWSTSLTGEDAGKASLADMPGEAQQLIATIPKVGAKMATNYMALAYLGLLIPTMTLFTVLFFKPSDEGFIETFRKHFPLNTYLWGTVILLILGLLGVFALTESRTLWALGGLALGIGYIVPAQMKVFGLGGWRGLIKALAAYLLGYGTYVIVNGIVMVSVAAALVFL